MRTLLYVIIAAAPIAIAACLALYEPEPSCEERGGEYKFSHTTPTLTFIGNVWVINNIAHYKCVLPESSDED